MPGLFQRCTGCGGSCQGVVVTLLDEAERERIVRLAAELDVDAPLSGRGLRQEGGRCVFLDARERCRLHATYGSESKPVLCRQYPLVATRVGDQTRLGIDPGCFTHATTWQGPESLSMEGAVALRVPLPESEARTEAALLDLLGKDGMTVERFASMLCREAGEGWPPAFASRLCEAAADPALRARLDSPDTSPMVRATVLALLDAAGPGPVPVLAHQAYALDALHRLVHLRLCHRIPSVVGVAALALMGLALAARLEPDEARLGGLFAGWTRAMRAPVFWGTLLPDGQRLMRLMAG